MRPIRSSGTIPAARKKTLWTENGKGEQILLFHAYDENHEADFIASSIQKMKAEYNCDYSSFAVLYRTNAQSRAIEAAMRVYHTGKSNRQPWFL